MSSSSNNIDNDVEVPEITTEAESISEPESFQSAPDPWDTKDSEFRSSLRRKIISFAWPCVAELFLVSLIAMVSLIMVGHLGAYAITAVGITNQPVLISVAVFQAFNVGATALVARFIGAKEYSNAKTVVIQALAVSIFTGTLMCITGVYFAKSIVVAMGAQEDTVAYAELYLKYMSVGIIFQAIPTAVSSLLRGAGDTKSPMRYNIASNIINVVFGYPLIYGFWFIPGFGVEGAAIASTLAKISACAMSIYIICTSKLPIAVTLKDKFRLDFSMLKRIMNIGIGAAGEQLVLRVGLILFTKMVADLGTVYFAAHQIGININSLSFNFGQALGMAATSFTGRSLGAKKPEMAENYCREIRRMGMVISIFISASFLFFGAGIARLYTPDAAVIVNVVIILRILALIIPAQNSQIIIAGGLRGAGDTRWTLISTFCGVFFVRVILAFFLIKVLMLGLVGAWIAVGLDQLVRSTVIYLRFRNGKWKLLRV